MSATPHTVLVLGASPNRRRYSNEAVRQLQSLGYRVIPVHPVADEIEGLPVIHRLDEVSEPVDTLALYVGPQRSAGLAEGIVALQPDRVIFNPGTEAPDLERRLSDAGLSCIRACVLVMLRSGTF
jgi:predicted CoA-binding protein